MSALDSEVIRVAAGLCLSVTLWLPHQCHQCSANVDHLELHGLSCRKSQGRYPRHAAVNVLIRRSLANIPSHLEPSGIMRSDGKRPDGATVMPWKNGRTMVWDATCLCSITCSSCSHGSRDSCKPGREE